MQFDIKDITISDKALFDQYFANYNGINSEYTFTNMFMWRKSYNIRYAIIDKMLCIFSRHGESAETINFPIGEGNPKPVLEKLFEYFDEIGMDAIPLGDGVGWNIDRGYIQFEFDSRLTDDNRPCIVVYHKNPPQYEYK